MMPRNQRIPPKLYSGCRLLREVTMVWLQTYNPLGNARLSTLVAAVPIIVLLGALSIFRINAPV